MIDDSTAASLRDELAALRAEVARLQAQLEGPEPPATDRRGFFRLAASAAAGAVVAGVGAGIGGAEPAAAATGDPLEVGQVTLPSTVTGTTTLQSPSSTTLMASALEVHNFSSSLPAREPDLRVAIGGTTAGLDASGGFRIGVLGEVADLDDPDAAGVGVYGTANVVGAPTLPSAPAGVLGAGGGDAVGVHAVSTNGVALFVEGGLEQKPSASAGPPTAGRSGAQHRDALGDLYVCTATGPPATWRKVVTQHPGFAAAGGSINLLDRPIRLIDTRADSTAPITLGKVRPAVGVDTAAIDVTGVVVGGLQVPDGARGIIGTVTTAESLGTGFLSLFPGTATFPGTSNLNFTAAAPVATGFTCRLATNGTIKLRVGSAATHVIVDVAAFLF